MSIDALYRQHLPTVYKFFYFKTFNKATAEDLTSQTFLIMVEKMGERAAVRDPKKFLYGVMRNVWLRHLQLKYRLQEQSLSEVADFEAYVQEELGREVETSDEDRIKRYIEQLPAAQQQVMTLRLLNQHTLSEICAQLGKDMNYVKTTQRRGIANLHKLLEGGGA